MKGYDAGRFVLVTLLFMAGLALSGCGGPGWDIGPWWKGLGDQTATVAAGDESELSPILSALDPMDEWRETFRNAESPTLADLEWSDEDYKIGPSDVVNITVMDLFAEGVESPFQRMVTNEGFISLPLLKERVAVAGLTGDEARRKIMDAYKPRILMDPTVSLLIAGQRQNIFSIVGPVARPSSYPIPRRDYRLLRALTDAGDVVQRNIRYIYIFRQRDGSDATPRIRRTPGTGTPLTPGTLPPLPGTGTGTKPMTEAELEAFRELQGYVPATPPATPPAITPTPPVPTRPTEADDLEELRRVMPGVKPEPMTRPVKPTMAYMTEMSGRLGGPDRWHQARLTEMEETVAGGLVATPSATPATGQIDPDDPFGYAQADMSRSVRIIAIDLRKLKEGDARQNIIIRDGDSIVVPTVTFGEFYVMGQVARPGVYDLSGRRVTAKMALGAAGGDQELRIPLRLDLIMAGKEPDVMLKPDDVIAVGTHMAAPFLAVARNAFRMTYGLGFIYDRNFAEKNFGQFNGVVESVRFFR